MVDIVEELERELTADLLARRAKERWRVRRRPGARGGVRRMKAGGDDVPLASVSLRPASFRAGERDPARRAGGGAAPR